ncbi:MAG: class I SAM-dependent methyltransferase [Gemmatimonadetes bacterium]|nr:class I SAM-dependent methyltransferase [Gemmatimonadota bacterium]
MASERPASGRGPERAAPAPPIYGEDLAHIHHVGFGDLARDAAPALVEELRRAGMTGGLVVDLACGSGILARELGAAGYDVLGVDVSPAIIALARATAPAARFVVASLSEFRIPECAAAFCIGEGLGYLEPDRDRVDLDALVARVHDALAPGGVFAFDVLERTDDAPMRYEVERRAGVARADGGLGGRGGVDHHASHHDGPRDRRRGPHDDRGAPRICVPGRGRRPHGAGAWVLGAPGPRLRRRGAGAPPGRRRRAKAARMTTDHPRT